VLNRGVIRAFLAALAVCWAGAAPARADPAVQGIVIASVPLLIWSMFADGDGDAQPDFLTLGGGQFDVIDDENQAGEFRVEYRSNLWLWKFKPFIGAAGTTDEGFYGYGGLRLDVYFGRRLVVAPSVAAVGYEEGEGKDLGSSAVLRSGLDVAYRFDDDSQLGLAFHHMSHGEVFGEENPGTETLAVTYSIPLKNILGN